MNRAQRRASEWNGRRLMKQGWTDWEEVTSLWLDRGIGIPFGCSAVYKNAIYVVQFYPKDTSWGEVLNLMVRRNDGAPVRAWHDLQRIKNELVGEDRVAIEVYPTERNLVDQANIYHLWVLPRGFELPFGLHISGQGKDQGVNL